MKYEDIKVGMRVKINLDKEDALYSDQYDQREGTVVFIGKLEDDEYCIDVNVKMFTGEIEAGVMFKPSELSVVD